MADFGIDIPNIPALLGMHQQLKQQRLADLYQAQRMKVAEREADLAERKADREAKTDAAMAKVFASGAKGGDPSSGSSGATQSPTASPQALPGLDQDLPPRTDGVTIDQNALRELYALDPEKAQQIQKFVYDNDERTLKQATARGEAMAQVAYALKNVPADQRPAAYQTWAPYLLDRGYSQQQVARVQDFSDRALDNYYRQGRSLEAVIKSEEGARDDARQTERDAEGRRHNRAMEGNAAGNLALSRQR